MRLAQAVVFAASLGTAWTLVPPAAAHGFGREPDDVALRDATAILLGLIGLVYLMGLIRRRGILRRAMGVRWRVFGFVGGWLALAAAMIWPLPLWDHGSFAAHMMEHEILMLVAAPLFAAARPWAVLRSGLPATWGRRGRSLLRALAVPQFRRSSMSSWIAFGAHAIALWVWHAPGLFDAALDSAVVHALQHACFFGTAFGFWWVLLARRGSQGDGLAVGLLLLTVVHSGMLGALITFAPHVIYGASTDEVRHWGLTPLDDQQLGGLIMWVPGGLIYTAAGLFILGRWLKGVEMRARVWRGVPDAPASVKIKPPTR
ncbi:MAG TPA: cytochrome c oxidase assembly protein [Alphaproteobacteria bacterium]